MDRRRAVRPRARLEALSTPTAKFDLEFNYFTDPEEPGLLCYLEYATELFDRSTAESIVTRYVRAIRELVAAPGKPVGLADELEPVERERLLSGLNDTAVETPELTVPGLVERQVEVSPDAVAVVCGDVSLIGRRPARRWRRVPRHRATRRP